MNNCTNPNLLLSLHPSRVNQGLLVTVRSTRLLLSRDAYVFNTTGENDRGLEEGSEQSIRVQGRFKHPRARRNRLDSDLALLKLATPAKLTTFVRTVCLPVGTDKRLVRPGKFSVLTGWGSTQVRE